MNYSQMEKISFLYKSLQDTDAKHQKNLWIEDHFIGYFDNPSKITSFINLAFYDSNKEQGIEGRYNWRGSPYHMIVHALQGTPFL